MTPNSLGPMLKDGDLRLTESSATLKYLAEIIGLSGLSRDIGSRARVNGRIDWINTIYIVILTTGSAA
jgi:glutathione S-transferase